MLAIASLRSLSSRTTKASRIIKEAAMMKRLLLAVLGFDAITKSSGGLWGVPNTKRCIFCRGGSFPPSNYEESGEGHSYGGYPSQGMSPPDLPQYGEEDPMFSQGPPPSHQHHHQQQQQHHPQHGQPPPPMHPNEPPPLPPDYGDAIGGMPPPPAYQGDSLFQEPDNDIDSFAGAEMPQDSSGMDLSIFDKEYILKGLARLYRKKILPLELSSRYGHFHSPPLSPSDFVAPPMVLLLGQYRYVSIEILST